MLQQTTLKHHESFQNNVKNLSKMMKLSFSSFYFKNLILLWIAYQYQGYELFLSLRKKNYISSEKNLEKKLKSSPNLSLKLRGNIFLKSACSRDRSCAHLANWERVRGVLPATLIKTEYFETIVSINNLDLYYKLISITFNVVAHSIHLLFYSYPLLLFCI